MEVFSSVVAEIAETVFALLPLDENVVYERRHGMHSDNSSPQSCPLEHDGSESVEHTTNHRAQFLEEKLKELNTNVIVMSENSTDTASTLKLCGGWSDICAVRLWLMQFIQTKDHRHTVSDREQPEARSRREAHCTESLPDMPRRSWRIRHMTQDHNTNEALSSTITGSKQVKRKQLKQKGVHTKKGQMLLTNTLEARSGNCNKSEEMLESYANCTITKGEANVSDIMAPVVMLASEQSATENSVIENEGSSCTETCLLRSAGEMSSEACSELKERADIDECKQKSTLTDFKCESCDYVTRKQRNLLMHVTRTHGDRSYVCSTCSRTFAIAKDLNHHLKCHTEQYCCEHCGRTLKSKCAVALHVARIHKGGPPRPVKRYLCTLCGKLCRNKTDYTVHRNKEHIGVRPFHCDVCSASFFSMSNLRAHRQIHADARSYECKQCGKTFKQRQGLRTHQAVHSVERRYKCDTCSKAFTQHSALVRHARTHTSARPYTCQLCPATFNDYSVLRRHMLGIHKVLDATVLRQSVQAACADARRSEQLSAVKSDSVTNSVLDCRMSSNNEGMATSTTAAGIDNEGMTTPTSAAGIDNEGMATLIDNLVT